MDIENLAKNAKEFTSNTYLVNNKILIDTGKGETVRKAIDDVKDLEKVLITHSHYDHVDNLSYILKNKDVEIYAYKQLEKEVNKIEDGEILKLSEELRIRTLHTPGHKDDHLCYYIPDQKVLFTGDLIFEGGGFGRTDLAEGDRDKLIDSIKKIQKYTEAREFYPGHNAPVKENAKRWIQKSLEEAKKREKKYE